MSRLPEHSEDRADATDHVAVFAEALLTGSEVDPLGTEQALSLLRGYVLKINPSIGFHDAQDIVAGSIAKILESRRRLGNTIESSHATSSMYAGYLLKVLRNSSIDHVRKRQHLGDEHLAPLPSSEQLSDEQVIGRFDRDADIDLMHQALDRVYRDGDSTTFQVVAFMLNTLQRTGRVPSNRQTGKACGISHTAVAKAVHRFRKYLTRPTP